MVKKLLSSQPIALNVAQLITRLLASLLMMQYGWEKFSNYSAWSADFPDPLGVGSAVSLALCIFAELVCSIFLAAGLFTRAALIPLIFNMVVVVLVIHSNDDWRTREHAFIFLILYLILFLSGPGKYSLDHVIFRKKLK
jgi:putative oxidoreductase